MEAKGMDPLNDLFSEGGWVVARNIDGKIKVTSDIQSSSDFNDTGVNWVTLPNSESNQLTKANDEPLTEEKEYKMLYKNIVGENSLTGFFLIRDLLNLQKPNDLSDVFIANGMRVETVTVCAKITSIEIKENHRRLIVDDGTSAILCVVKNASVECNLQNDELNDDGSKLTNNHPNTLCLLAQLKLRRQKLIRDSSTELDQPDLGIPLMIVGKLKQFQGKNFIFAFNVRRVTENYFMRFMNYVIQSYEYKVNFVLK